MENQTTENTGKNTTMAAVAYLLFVIPLMTDAKKDPFVKYHIKQSIVLLVASIAANIVMGVVPGLLAIIVNPILGIALLVLFIKGLMNALGGKEVPLPVIGQFAEKINI